MMSVKTRAVVLRTVKLDDAKCIVDMLTETNGRMGFIVRLGQTKASRARKMLFQPLSLLDIEFDDRPSSQLKKLRNVQLLQAYGSIPFESYKLAISLFIADFLCHATRDEQQNRPLFSYVVNSLLWLDGSTSAYSNFHLVFLMRLTKFLGIYPNVEDYADGDFFDLRGSSFCKQPPMHTDYLSAADAGRIVALMRMDYETMHLFRLNREERNRILDVAERYYRLHIPDFPELKSLRILRELWI